MSDISVSKILKGLRIISQEKKSYKTECEKYLKIKTLTENDRRLLKEFISDLILSPDSTVLAARCFAEELLAILETTMLSKDSQNDTIAPVKSCALHNQYCVVLSKLLRVHPDVPRFCLKYFSINPSPFHYKNQDIQVPKKKYKPNKIITITDYDIVQCCLKFLKQDRDHFVQIWNWSHFIEQFKNSTEERVKWMCYKCVSIITLMSELQFRKFCQKENVEIDYMYIKSEIHQNSSEVKFEQNVIFDDENLHLGPSLDKGAVAQVMDIYLPKHNNTSIIQNRVNLITVQSTARNLRRVALAVAAGRAVCLTGCVGCGKTTLVEQLANITSSKLFKVQLGDQTDSKMLLGSYRCSDVPGEFIWGAGVLTQCVINGHWLMLEDIDSASLDVLSVLSVLMESNKLSVPGYRDQINVAPGFQLFLTQRMITSATGHNKRSSSNLSHLLNKNLIQVHMDTLTYTELITIVAKLYPPLETVASRIAKVYLNFSSGNHENDSEDGYENVSSLEHLHSSGRLISTRDLMKWCDRAIKEFNVSSQESALKIFQDAIDLFCGFVAQKDIRLKLANHIASVLGIVSTYADFYMNSYKPNITITSRELNVGRTLLLRKQAEFSMTPVNEFTYTYTKPSACLLERVATCVSLKEPVLLVGETGTGKTSSIQYLAAKMGHKLVVINMNQQSDSSDLLGGYKPVDMKFVITPVRREFENMFRSFYNQDKNEKFLGYISMIYSQSDWKSLVKMMKKCQVTAISILTAKDKNKSVLFNQWQKLGSKLEKLEALLRSKALLAFSFIEGSLVRAVQNGDWVLLDEINLASAETLECLSGLLEGTHGTLSLLERGDCEPISRHPDFTLFACMNPATDVGKKNLPAGIRNRFTELYVEELTETNDLLVLVEDYLKILSPTMTLIQSIVKFYLTARKEAVTTLFDGTGQQPHYSLRTLCRALHIGRRCVCGSARRSLYEALCVSFLTQLDRPSHGRVAALARDAALGKGQDAEALLRQPLPELVGVPCVQFEGYWVPKGDLEPTFPDGYILTESVHKNLCDLARIVSIGRLPVLIQGDTSVGKTSLITYLAKASGNLCIRINNHEHTDLQEYIGSYVANENGLLTFCEGPLVQAMRHGHWIILDELNLAPSEVLEALNRVLDDNRELFITETQTVVKAHRNFMLFATQNPPGLYGGRKILSRAFRNRFIELHFTEIPANELQTILCQRCHVPPSYSKKMVAVMTELQLKRRGSAAYAGKLGYMTLRDLFRWGERYRLASNSNNETYYDWEQHIADEGYLVLASRVREHSEKVTIQEVIKKHIKRTADEDRLFTLSANTSSVSKDILEELEKLVSDQFPHIVWTKNLRRLMVLMKKAFQYKEPALLVGETGCGKTTVCQVLANHINQKLKSVNCHMHSEASDFLGGLRPIREKKENAGLFEWVDGPLIEAMQNGELFLADEISLADDSVLERLNSLLEPERKLLLAEKNAINVGNCEVTAVDAFHFCATMNPSGDYGKKELSPALRNRFTEIWCDPENSRSDLLDIINHNLQLNNKILKFDVGNCVLDFIIWFKQNALGTRFVVSIRDILTWIKFLNICSLQGISVEESYAHGACLVFLERLESEGFSASELRRNSIKYILKQLEVSGMDVAEIRHLLQMDRVVNAEVTQHHFGIKPFYIEMEPQRPTETQDDAMDVDCDNTSDFVFMAPTTGMNTLRVLRGMQLNKPVLIEGSPGVGKTSLITAIAKVTSHNLVRINLSEHTDISDLFGADLPVEGEKAGTFAWRDGPFLQALKQGHWVLLDELNLAPQPVLEGLNACFDHRGEVFIPELNRSFQVKSGTRFFACQNPLSQGGARKGLPQSFLNRFTQVHIGKLSSHDLEFITASQYADIPKIVISKMVKFIMELAKNVGELRTFGHKGSPWEFNLRDILRWCDCLSTHSKLYNCEVNPGRFIDIIFTDRMRTHDDKQHMRKLYDEIFCENNNHAVYNTDSIKFHITSKKLYIGDCEIERGEEVHPDGNNLLLLRNQLPALRTLGHCVNMNWMTILVGDTNTGKSSIIALLAKLCNKNLKILSVNSAMDTTEILGGFEQTDYTRHLQEIMDSVYEQLLAVIRIYVNQNDAWLKVTQRLLSMWEHLTRMMKEREGCDKKIISMAEELNLFSSCVDVLNKILLALKEMNISADMALNLQKSCDRLINLQTCFKEDNLLTTGGKFEWVDSILVKCLLSGDWLLMDNVNLCTAAVLDRLNGLVEPNGELILSERGVNAQGQLITIKPHPNFRLFMTMDPRHGEISRAMRNRGVEICILDPLDLSENSQDILDLKALLRNADIQRHSVQETLLKVHQVTSDLLPVYDKPNVGHLLQTSFLIAQQINRGTSISKALAATCADIYVKSKSTRLQPLLVKELIEKINDISENYRIYHKYDVSSDLNNCTLSTDRLSENCIMTLVMQQCQLFFSLVQYAENKATIEEVKSFLYRIFPQCYDFSCIDTQSLMGYLLLLIYQTSCINDLNSRFFYIESNLKTYTQNNADNVMLYRRINRLFCDIIKDSNHLSDVAVILPWDCRNSIEKLDTKFDSSSANKILLHLYFVMMKNIENTKQNTLTKSGMTNLKSKTITVYEYSNAVLHNQLTDSINLPIVKYYGVLIKYFDDFIERLLSDCNFALSTKKLMDLYCAVQWRFRFQRIGSMVIINKQNKNANYIVNVVAQLIVHYQWFMKWCLKTFEAISNISQTESFTNLEQMKVVVSLVNSSVNNDNTPLQSLRKRFCKFNKISPYCSFEQADLYIKYDKLNKMLSVWTYLEQFHLSTTNSRIKVLCNAEGKLNRNDLIRVYVDLQNKNYEQATEILERIEKFCHKNLTPNDNLLPEHLFERQLWILREFYILQMVNFIKPYLLNEISGIKSYKLTNHALSLEACINYLNCLVVGESQIPASFVYHLNRVCETSSKVNLMELAQAIDEYELNYLSLASSMLNQNIVSDMENLTAVTKHSPILLRIIIEILKPEDKILNGLETLSSRKSHLTAVNKLLWNNMITLNNINITKLSAISAIENFQIFVMDLSLCLKLNASSKKISDIAGLCITRINSLYSECNENIQKQKIHISQALSKSLIIMVSLDELIKENNKNKQKNIEIVYQTGLLNTFLGFLKLTLACSLGPMDSIEKHNLKLQYIKEEISSVSNFILAEQLNHYIRRGNNSIEHDYYHELNNLNNNLITREEKLSETTAIRPVANYSALVKDCSHFLKTLVSVEFVFDLIKKIEGCKISLCNDCFVKGKSSEDVLHLTKQLLSEIATWKYSQVRFSNQIKSNFSSYPDLVKPICNAITLLTTGTQCIEESLIKLNCEMKNMVKNSDEILYNLVQFPYMSVGSINFVEDLIAGKTAELLKNGTECSETFKVENHNLMLNAMAEIKNHCVSSNYINRKNMDFLNTLFQEFVNEWQMQEKDKEQKKIDEDNLYVTKVKCQEESEEEQATDEIEQFFPSFLNVDFFDFKTDSLNNYSKDGKNKKTTVDLITSADIKCISSMHMHLMIAFTKTEWLQPDGHEFGIDYLEPLVKRYETFTILIKHLINSCDHNLDVKLLTTINLVTKVMLDQLNVKIPQCKSPKSTKYDFYTDSNVDKAGDALHTLHDILEVVKKQLEEWPEHPILNDIVTIINRVINFPVSSPLSRFLTGIELLRDKVEEWNKNAHRENNLKSHALELAQLIISWRKLELNCWRDCLNVAQERQESNAYRYWFYIYAVIDQYFKEPEMTLDDINKILKQFIEKSNISEYKTRLHILYAFHCHIAHFTQSSRRDLLLSLLWNLHVYYHQFIVNVENHLRELRTPIEKKLRDFVKITSWDKNLSYWGVKESVDKTHRTLHKHIKEFQEVLQKPVTKCLCDNELSMNDNSVGIWDRPHRQLNQYQYMLEPLNYIANIKLKRLLEKDVNSKSLSMSNMTNIFNKARSICKEVILLSTYPGKLQTIDIMLTQIIDSTVHFRNLEVNKDLPKNKQISQAKSILQLKRKALSDLFKYLMQLGLSYRSGLLESNIRGNDMISFSIAPINIKVSMGLFKSKKSDGPLLTVWEGCEKYYFRSIARYSALDNIMKNPAPDLGSPNIERCRGFAADMLLLTQSQKQELVKNSKSLVILRSQIEYLTMLEDVESCPNQSLLENHFNVISDVFVTIITTLKQYLLILNCCPNPEDDMAPDNNPISFDHVYSNSSFTKFLKNDSTWLYITSHVTNVINGTEKMLNTLNKQRCKVPIVLKEDNQFKSLHFKSPNLYQFLLEGYAHLKNVFDQLQDICNKFETFDESNPLCDSLHNLQKVLQCGLCKFNKDTEQTCNYKVANNDVQIALKQKIEKIVTCVQISIQNIYKKYMNKNTAAAQSEGVSNTIEEETENEPKDDEKLIRLSDIENNHLTKLIQGELNEDIQILKLEEITQQVESVLVEASRIQENNDNNYAWLKPLLLTCVPLLEQMLLLSQFYITQQVATHRITCKMLSVLLNVFNELGMKGFCVPPEFSDEVQGDGKECNGGLGLGDGEGEKDVSERIENEDQLQDAHQEGTEPKQQEDKDCEEEDKGIEMSDDFDGKLQDVKKTGDEEDSDNEDDDNDDADKQMGDTEEGAEQLDQQIWGGDEQEEDQEENEQGEGGEGQDTGEKEMSACDKESSKTKDEQDPTQTGDNEEEEKNQKKEINDMEEPDVNDDQINPYHGDMEPPPEPEPLDLPDDMQLDDGDGMKEDETKEDEDPFNIDAMKEQMEPPKDEGEVDGEDPKTEENNDQNNSSDDSDDEDSGPLKNDENEDGMDQEPNAGDEDKPPEIKTADVEDIEKQQDIEINEDKKQDLEEKNDPNAAAAQDQTSQQPEAEGMETNEPCSTDQTTSQIQSKEPQVDDKQKPMDNSDKSKDGEGKAQEEQPDHSGSAQDDKSNITQSRDVSDESSQPNLRKQMNKANDNRTLGENNESFNKSLKTVDVNESEQEIEPKSDFGPEEKSSQFDMYQHVQEAKDFDKQVMDSATSEQTKNNPLTLEEKGDEVTPEDEIAMDVDEPEILEQVNEELQPESIEKSEKNKPETKSQRNLDQNKQDMDADASTEVDGERILTFKVERDSENAYCTSENVLREDYSQIEELTTSQMDEMRLNVEQNILASLTQLPTGLTEWEKLWWRTSAQARDLCEQLRLLLEPTLSARLKGDYKTGRRINMRKVVPYVASEFRKDKIWLRRTMPSKREYKIAIAIDDSSSMCGNQSTEMACESVALVSQALSLLEVGDLSVLSFGETPKILHPFQEQFSSESGARIMAELTFQQNKSRFAKLLDFVGVMFKEHGRSDSAAELLIIVSDGCISSENLEVVRQSVRRLRQAKVFIIFLIVDNVKNNCSMVDTRVPVFNDKQQLVQMQWAMDIFPFPFYLFLRDLTSLPSILSDALRQWFDLMSKMNV